MSTPWSGVLRNDFTWVSKPSSHNHYHSRLVHGTGLPEWSGTESHVKVEVCPRDGDYTSDPMKWPVTIDEHRRPQWVEDEWPRVEDSARRQAAAWARDHIVRDNGGTIGVGHDESVVVSCATGIINVASCGVGYVIGSSSPARINVATGGECYVGGSSAPATISVAPGGRCYVIGSSAPATISVDPGGECYTRGTSAPGTINVAAGGRCFTYDSSAPGRIDVAYGGMCYTYGTSAPGVIEVADGGWCQVRDSSAPARINVAAGGNVDWRSSVPSEGRIVYAK